MPTLKQLRVVDPVLSNISLGYTNSENVSQFLFPFLPNQKRGGKLVKFGKEAFKLYNTLRAMRAKSQRVNWSDIPTVTLALEDHTFEDGYDDEEISEQTPPISLQRRALDITNGVISLDREKAAADLAQATGTYAAGNTVTLSGTSQWNDAASTPIDDIRAGREAIRGKIGRYPNTLLMGPITFNKLIEHASIVDKIKYTQRGIVTEEVLASVFGINRVVVGKAVYSNASGAFSDVWGKHAILAWVPPSPGQFIPAFGYTPRLVGKPAVSLYREEPKMNVVFNEDVWQVLVTTDGAGYFIQNAVA